MPSLSDHPHWISELLSQSVRSKKERRIGIEIERLARWNDGEAWIYRKKRVKGQERIGAQWLLDKLSEDNQWSKKTNEKGEALGLNTPFGSVSLEPGSQVELSSLPLCNLLELKKQVEIFETKVSSITKPLGLQWLSLGVHPTLPVEKIELIPSKRYQLMTDYFPKTGKLGTSMMRRTASIQLNFDYTSETEAIEMLRVALSLAPVSYGLFGNSPFAEGKPSGYLSFRAAIWKDTDPSRTGLLPFVFADDFSFEKYATYLWSRPLMFVPNRSGSFISAQGRSVAEIAQGLLPDTIVNEGVQHWAIQQLFTEARIKPGYIEVRSIDGLDAETRFAAAAFWLGIMYSDEARRWVLKTFTPASDLGHFLDSTIRHGTRAKWHEKNLSELSRSLYELAQSTLINRGLGEEKLLTPLENILKEDLSPGAKLMNRYESNKLSLEQILESVLMD